MKKQVNGSKNDRSATILGILHLRYMAQWEIVAPKELVDDFDANEKIGQGILREIVSVHTACLQRRNIVTRQQLYNLYCGYVNCNRHSGGSRSAGRHQIFGEVLKQQLRQTQQMGGGLGNKTTSCSRRIPFLSRVQGIRAKHS